MPYQNHAVYVEDADDDEIELVATIEWWPDQYGGFTDPSWDSGWQLVEVTINGAVYPLTESQTESINAQIVTQLESDNE